MSGHSKWSKVKHQKESTDAVKGKIFTKLANAIIIAVKDGGGNGDPNTNFKLRLAIEKARSQSMPKEKIERAVEHGKGKGGGMEMAEIHYEAFGPLGIGILIEVATDNKQRTVAALKNLLDRNGGVLATTGSVTHLFTHVGLIRITKGNLSADDLMEAAINAGALDLEENGNEVEIYTDPANLHAVKEKLQSAGIPALSFELYYKPVATIPVTDQNQARRILNLIDMIEEAEDVQRVFANYDIPDQLLEAVANQQQQQD